MANSNKDEDLYNKVTERRKEMLAAIAEQDHAPDDWEPRAFVPYLLTFCFHQIACPDGGYSIGKTGAPYDHDRREVERAFKAHDRLLEYLLSDDFHYHQEGTAGEGKYECPGRVFTWGNFEMALNEIDLTDLKE